MDKPIDKLLNEKRDRCYDYAAMIAAHLVNITIPAHVGGTGDLFARVLNVCLNGITMLEEERSIVNHGPSEN